jgi:hypothetical protein
MVVEFWFYTVAEMVSAVLDLRAIMIRQTHHGPGFSLFAVSVVS